MRLVALLTGALLSVAGQGAAAASPAHVAQPAVPALLDVPYLPQTPELCGGAAAAMVLRYWGARDVFPQDFAALVVTGNERGDGIPTGSLAAAVRERGWLAVVIPASDGQARSRLQSEVDRGRPVIALVEVGPRTYHYVVIVGTTDQLIVFHDPARAPLRVMRWQDFDQGWMATERWMMVVLPPPGEERGRSNALRSRATMPASAVVSVAPAPCAALVERAVDLARAGDPDGAEELLVAATRMCPQTAAAFLELAGLRFSQSKWQEAEGLASAAVRLAPEDGYAHELVASSRFLMGDPMGALDAWGWAGEPRLDVVDIHGLERTPHPLVIRASALEPRQLLTSDAFGRALRRVRDLPVASGARMRYQPLDGGRARVDVFIDERPLVPRQWTTLAIVGMRALARHEAIIEVAGPMGAGELWSAAARWAAGRPRIAFGLAVPSPSVVPGILSFGWSTEEQLYAATRESRRRLDLHVSDWLTSRVRWQAGAALDRFEARDHVAVEGGLDLRLARDRLAVSVFGGAWTPLSSGSRFGNAGVQAAWRSTSQGTRPVWSATTRIEGSSRTTPRAIWHGAGTGEGRSGLLRAHPLIIDGRLSGPVFGRHVAHGTLEHSRAIGRIPGGAVRVAAFVDAARAWGRRDTVGASPFHVDAGLGLRARMPGGDGTIRLDVARGIRGGGTAVSVGWGAVWPGW